MNEIERENLEALKEAGYDNWNDYIRDIADDNGVDYDVAQSIFDLLGPDEAFDGFITMIEDASYGY